MDYDNQFAAKIVEVVRETSEVAFEAKFYGKEMTESQCSGDVCHVKDGFFMYSVERFYDAPLVYDASYERKTGALSFKTANTYKQSSKYDGAWALYDAAGAKQSDGAFAFDAFWRATTVDAAAVADLDGDLTLVVTNQHGTDRSITVTA